MALVPIRCPSCNASVDLEEGQTIVRCEYCHTTSYLPQPARAAAAPPPAPAVPRAPTAPSSSGRTTAIVLAVFGLIIGGLVFAAFRVGGVNLNHFEDGEGARAIIAESLGEDVKLTEIYLQPSYMMVWVLEAEDKVVGRRIRGRSLGKREPRSIRKGDDPTARAFGLDEVDFTVAPAVANHARGRVEGGQLTALVYKQRESSARHSWEAHVDVDGKIEIFFYGPDGEPRVDEPLAIVPSPDPTIPKRLRDGLGFEPRVIRLYLSENNLLATVITKGSDVDTDTYSLYPTGVVSSPRPNRSDQDAAALKAAAFSLKDVRWKDIGRMVDTAEKKHAGRKVDSVGVERRDGALQYRVSVKSERGGSKSLLFDAEGKPAE